MRFFVLILTLLISGHLPSAQAQNTDDSKAEAGQAVAEPRAESDLEVEQLYDKYDSDEQAKKAPPRIEPKAAPKDVNNLTELSNLAPFSDIAVIQRRFLPRTGRFELSGNGMVTLNNPFFNNMGLALRGSYNFVEKHGVELQYFMLSNAKRDVTTNLEKDRNILTKSLVTPKSYMGVAYKWTPIYGKITFINKQIVPFDFAFTAGGGLTETDEKSGEPTVHIGSGQVFALSKGMAFRWDFIWNFYQAQATDDLGAKTTTSHNDLFLSLGMSFFFPEASYR